MFNSEIKDMKSRVILWFWALNWQHYNSYKNCFCFCDVARRIFDSTAIFVV